MLLKLLQSIIDGFAGSLIAVVSVLPKSPFTLSLGSLDGSLMSAVAWFVPIPQIIALLEAWGVAVGAFYLYMILLRFVKAI